MNFEKIQDLIPPEQSIWRQHAIPFEIRKFAGETQLEFTGKRGRGRANVPTLADIYYQLMIEGLNLIGSGVKPTFNEIGQPNGCSFTRIKLHTEVDTELRVLKNRADEGEFIISPYKQISLISVAVTLMLLAIADRKGDRLAEADYPEPNLKKPKNKKS